MESAPPRIATTTPRPPRTMEIDPGRAKANQSADVAADPSRALGACAALAGVHGTFNHDMHLFVTPQSCVEMGREEAKVSVADF